jgi:hypothetical protein
MPFLLGELANARLISVAAMRAEHAVRPDSRLNEPERGGFVVKVLFGQDGHSGNSL